jgi:hypothetical protein
VLHLFPSDLAAFVLFFQPAHQRLEVISHGAGGVICMGKFSAPPTESYLSGDGVSIHQRRRVLAQKSRGLSDSKSGSNIGDRAFHRLMLKDPLKVQII